jgi:hypothetical protein
LTVTETNLELGGPENGSACDTDYLTPNLKTVVLLSVFPGWRIEDGNSGWFGESG